jgi:hypothetical protein
VLVDAGDGVAEADRGLVGEAGREAEHSPLAAELGSSPASRALMPDVTAPSCTASSGNLFAAMLARASRAQTCRSAGSPALPGAVTSVLLHDIPGLSAVIAWAPHTQSSAFFALSGGSLPTYALFAARAAGGQTPAYAPEGISCALPRPRSPSAQRRYAIFSSKPPAPASRRLHSGPPPWQYSSSSPGRAGPPDKCLLSGTSAGHQGGWPGGLRSRPPRGPRKPPGTRTEEPKHRA